MLPWHQLLMVLAWTGGGCFAIGSVLIFIASYIGGMGGVSKDAWAQTLMAGLVGAIQAMVILPRFCGRPDKRETAARMNHHDHSHTSADHQGQAP